jgi:hypothetical protein
MAPGRRRPISERAFAALGKKRLEPDVEREARELFDRVDRWVALTGQVPQVDLRDLDPRLSAAERRTARGARWTKSNWEEFLTLEPPLAFVRRANLAVAKLLDTERADLGLAPEALPQVTPAPAVSSGQPPRRSGRRPGPRTKAKEIAQLRDAIGEALHALRKSLQGPEPTPAEVVESLKDTNEFTGLTLRVFKHRLRTWDGVIDPEWRWQYADEILAARVHCEAGDDMAGQALPAN